MTRLTARGLVVEIADYGETSLRAVAFAEEHGDLPIMARGARRPGKSGHMSSGLAPFASGRFDYIRRREDAMATLVELNIDAPREAIRLDLDAYAAGAPALELLRASPARGEEANAFLACAESFLDRVEEAASAQAPLDSAARAARRGEHRSALCDLLGRYLLEQLELLGHAPLWEECVATGRRLDPMEGSSFSIALGGRLSPEGERALAERPVGPRDARALSPDTLAIMHGWLTAEELDERDAPRPPEREPWRLYERPLNLLAVFARQHLDAKLKSYMFLRERFFG